MTDHNKIIDHIEKLMAMANDSSSPFEAAIALSRVQKLMAQHHISQDTLPLNQRHHYADCMDEGAAAAQNVQLNHGVDGVGQGKIGVLA